MSDPSALPDDGQDTTKKVLLGIPLTIGVIILSVGVVCCGIVIVVVLIDRLNLWCAIPGFNSLVGCS